MFDRHVTAQLARYLDGGLPSPERQRLEQHLSVCEFCRTGRDQVQAGMSMVFELPLVEAPDTIWQAIAAASSETHHKPRLRYWTAALAPIAILAVAGVAYWIGGERRQSNWELVSVQGSTTVDSRPLRGLAKVKPGEWIETGLSSTAQVQIAEIGTVHIAPDTRLRVATVSPVEHRLTLVRGEIHAKISAPPKLFFVDTASATAEDQGCEYSLKTDEAGSGLLQVTLGWVSLQGKGLESMVPAGASCRTRPRTGPGVPYFDYAPENFTRALETFESAHYAGPALDVILHASRVRDTLTLWHLLGRTALPEREQIYERIAALSPPPPGVSREKVLQLDAATLTRWREDLAWKW
jgi:hypothetical protein